MSASPAPARRRGGGIARGRARSGVLGAWLVGLTGLLCCESAPPEGGKQAAIVEEAVGPRAKTGPDHASGYSAQGCRMVRVVGEVRNALGRRLSSGTVLRGERWLSLSPGSQVDLQFQQGGKRFTVHGPARVLPCVAGEEVFLVGAGVLDAEWSAGQRPAAEALWATPQNAIRYGRASLMVSVDAQRTLLRVERGEARTVGPGSVVVRPGQGDVPVRLASLTSQQSLQRCVQSAEDAFQRSAQLLAASSSSGLELAPVQVQARRQAEEHCAMAAAAALQQLTGDSLTRRLKELDRARARLRTIPASRR